VLYRKRKSDLEYHACSSRYKWPNMASDAYFTPEKSHFSCFFSNFERNLFELHNSDFFLKSQNRLQAVGTIDRLKNSEICQADFEKKWAKVQTGQNSYLPQMEGDPPKQKLFLSGSLGPKSERVKWGKGALKGANSKMCPPPQNLNSIFSKKNR